MTDVCLSTVNDYKIVLHGSPSLAAVDGGNFRSRDPRTPFATGGYLDFDGATQYGTVDGLLDTPPVGGCIALQWKPVAKPTTDEVVFSKAAAYSGSDIIDGIELVSTAGGFSFLDLYLRMYVAGEMSEAHMRIQPLNETEVGDAHFRFFEIVVSWGTALRLWVDRVKFAEAPVEGGWTAGSAAPFSIGARFLGSASNHMEGAIDEIEVRNAEPSRAEVIRWFNRGGFPSQYGLNRWTRNPANPLITPNNGTEGQTTIEPRLVRLAAGDWKGVYTAGVSEIGAYRLFGMSSTDGKTLTKTGTLVMGGGAGGHSGEACRPFVFRDDDGSLHLYFSDNNFTFDGTIWHATSADGLTWTRQAALIEPDDTHTGWANPSVVRVDGTYYWMIEYRRVDGSFAIAHYTATSPAGPLTFVDDEITEQSIEAGASAASFSVGGFVHAGGRFHLFPHCSPLVYPTAIWHAVSDDCVRWEVLNGGNPVIDMDDFGILPEQDQVADAYVYELPDTGEVGMLFDIDDNHTTIDTRIMGATF